VLYVKSHLIGEKSGKKTGNLLNIALTDAGDPNERT